jgi:putative ABC transport system permease protein
VCVLGSALAGRLFRYRNPIGETIRIGADHCRVIGTLADPGVRPSTAGSFAWRDLAMSALVPLPVLTGRTIAIAPGQPVDEIWLQADDGRRVETLARLIDRALTGQDEEQRFVDIVVPRELLAQRYRTQRTFSIVVGSVALLALLIGGIGIMNIMLTSVVERTTEIGVRRTVGATRRAITLQFLTETLLMTVTGGLAGISLGVLASWGITRFAGWSTRVSLLAVGLAFSVSFVVGVVFGLYPAVKAARLEPVEALHHE